MSFIDIDSDEVNKIIIRKMQDAFKKQMKEILMQTAEEQVDKVIADLTDRLRAKLTTEDDIPDCVRKFKIEWILTRI